MKKIKKLSVVIVALAVCMLFSSTVWAVGTEPDETSVAEFSATIDTPTLHASDQEQTVTVTIAVNSADLYGVHGWVAAPTGWEYTITAGEGDAFMPDGNTFLWAPASGESVSNTAFVTITVIVPPTKTAGMYQIGLSKLDYVAGSYEAAEQTATDVLAYLFINGHTFNSKPSSQQAIAADCTNAAKYYVQCDSCSVVSDTKMVAVGSPDANAHAYSTEISGYTVDEANGTHTAYYECAHNAEHKDYGEPEEHSYTLEDGTKCVCGAEKPAAAGLKGDVDLNGAVDMDDAVMLMKHVIKAITIDDATSLKNAEVTNDTDVNMDDAVKLMKYVIKAIDSLN